MSLSNIGFAKQIKTYFKDRAPEFLVAKKEYTEVDIERKTEKCNRYFEEMHACVQKHGWNDNYCQVGAKAKYDQCVMKRDKMMRIREESLC